jgi:hypothetical protein
MNENLKFDQISLLKKYKIAGRLKVIFDLVRNIFRSTDTTIFKIFKQISEYDTVGCCLESPLYCVKCHRFIGIDNIDNELNSLDNNSFLYKFYQNQESTCILCKSSNTLCSRKQLLMGGNHKMFFKNNWYNQPNPILSEVMTNLCIKRYNTEEEQEQKNKLFKRFYDLFYNTDSDEIDFLYNDATIKEDKQTENNINSLFN